MDPGRADPTDSGYYYELHGQRDQDLPWLELTIGNTVAWFSPAPDGQGLRAEPERWTDDYPPNPTPEQLFMIAAHGELKAVDVSADPPYAALVGRVVQSVGIKRDPERDIVTGFGVITGNAQLDVWVYCDELFSTVRSEAEIPEV